MDDLSLFLCILYLSVKTNECACCCQIFCEWAEKVQDVKHESFLPWKPEDQLIWLPASF